MISITNHLNLITMKHLKSISKVLIVLLLLGQNSFAQQKTSDSSIKDKKVQIGTTLNEKEAKAMPGMTANNKSNINNINGGMPNRISMNVTVPKQTQGATFGEKVNAGKINVTLVEEGCVVLFPENAGYKVNIRNMSITELSANESLAFGEKVNQGLHAAGSALSQGASLLGGTLPGGAIISAAVSSVGNLAGGAGGGAAAASYAKNGKMVLKIQDQDSDSVMELPDGEYQLAFVIVENKTAGVKAISGVKDTLQTQVLIVFTVENGVLKTKHDTAKNSVGNIR